MCYIGNFEIYFISENYIYNKKATIIKDNVALNILYLAYWLFSIINLRNIQQI